MNKKNGICNETSFNQCGNILISDSYNNRVIEVNERGDIVWSFGLGPTDFSVKSPIGASDAQRIGKKTLITAPGIPAEVNPNAPTGAIDNRVMIVNKEGKIIWQYGEFGQAGVSAGLLNNPVQSTFVPAKKCCYQYYYSCSCCGKCHKSSKETTKKDWTILITDKGNNRVIEVNKNKEIVWQYPNTSTLAGNELLNPASALYLENGNILIADDGNLRSIEVNKQNGTVKILTAGSTLLSCKFASRLPNGNTLLTDSEDSRIVEVNKNDVIVWQYKTNAETNSTNPSHPNRGLRLYNGDTLITDTANSRVIRIKSNAINAYYGLPLVGTGYNLNTTQLGINNPMDAKLIGDNTGLTDVSFD